MAEAAGHWCITCGEYVRLGTHGLHEIRYGRVPLHPSPPQPPMPSPSDADAAFVVAAMVVVGVIALTGLCLLLFAPR